MDFICNITFVVAPEAEERFLDWARGTLVPSLFNNESPAMNPALRKVVEAGGEKPGKDHGVSIALHAEFATEAEVRKWHDIFLSPALGTFVTTFGQDSVFFITLLKALPI